MSTTRGSPVVVLPVGSGRRLKLCTADLKRCQSAGVPEEVVVGGLAAALHVAGCTLLAWRSAHTAGTVRAKSRPWPRPSVEMSPGDVWSVFELRAD